MPSRNSFALASLLIFLGLPACGGGSGGSGTVPTPTSPSPTTNPVKPTPTSKPITPSPTPTNKPVTPSPTPTSSATSTPQNISFGIDAGSTQQVEPYQPDTDNNGGTTSSTTATINTSKISSPAPQPLYQTQRSSPDLIYTIPKLIPSTSYVLRLHFVESTFTAAGKRIFNVSVNGSQLVTNYDIFATAGGENIANIQSFTVSSNATGQLIIEMKASAATASLAGLDLAIPPAPPANPNSLACTTTFAPGQYPVYSACFTGNTPLHHRYGTLLLNSDGTVQSQTLANNYWAQGQSGWNGERGNAGSNLYFATSNMSGQTITCESNGGGNGCGQTMYLPQNFIAQPGTTDHHVASFDLIHGNEQDIEGAASYTGDVLLYPTVYADGEYPLTNGTGICPGGNACWSGTAGGLALGASDLTYQELANYAKSGTHIGHALQLLSGCIDDTADQNAGAGVYPDAGKNPDTACTTPNPVYGALIHLKYSVSVPTLTSNPYCQAVLYAMQDYGGYTGDTSGNSSGVYAYTEGDDAYNVAPWNTAPNPWTSTIPALGQSLNSYFSTNDGCLSIIPNGNDVEVMYLNGKLPPQYPYGDARN